MSFEHPLRGGCQCGRNRYIIQVPQNASETAQVVFDTRPSHRISLATPLAAFIRVPLAWYHSTTFSFFPDETSAMIHRAYTHPAQEHSKRYFCGFCGTPLSYWSEDPRSEADYIQLTLGSLNADDLGDLEDLGLIPDADERPVEEKPRSPAPHAGEAAATTAHAAEAAGDNLAVRETLDLPWFDSMLSGSRLGGTLRASKGSHQSRDGKVKVEWEIYEWTGDDAESPNPAKRKRQEAGGPGAADTTMEGAQ